MSLGKSKNNHFFLSALIIICGLLYIFAYQFALPFKAEVFLYGMLIGLLLMFIYDRHIIISVQVVLFLLIVVSSFIGLTYTTMFEEGLRESILFAFFAGLFVLSLINPALIEAFIICIYIFSIFVALSSLVQFISPDSFNDFLRQYLREEAYEQLMWSYSIDTAYAGVAAYTPNTTFSAAIVFGISFLNLNKTTKRPIIKNKLLNILLLLLSMFCIIMCSKRGIFVATIAGLLVLLFFLYRGRSFLLKFLGITGLVAIILIVLYRTNDFVSAFLDRFAAEDFTTGRDDIYRAMLADFKLSRIFIGRGTGATLKIRETGAHNIYLQVLYDHGVFFSIPYYAFLLYNYYAAFKKQCPMSIFVQTIFLVYGLSGNPLYSNMFMMIYLYYVLYAARTPSLNKHQSSQ